MKRQDNGMRIEFTGQFASVSDEQKEKVEAILQSCACDAEWLTGAHEPTAYDDFSSRHSGVVSEWILKVKEEDVERVQAALDAHK